MAKKATQTKPLFGNRRSHANNATRHAFKPNLQTVTINCEKCAMGKYESEDRYKEDAIRRLKSN